MNFKENKGIVILFAIAIVVSIVFAVLAMMSYASINESNQEIAGQVKKVKAFQDAAIKPTEENLVKIQSELDKVDQRVAAIKMMYGHPEAVALNVFAKEVGVAVDSIRTVFPEIAKADPEGAAQNAPAFMAQIENTIKQIKGKEFSLQSYELAEKTTASLLQSLHILPITAEGLARELSTALNAPIKQANVDCKTELLNFIAKSSQYLAQDSAHPIALAADCHYGFDAYIAVDPTAEQILGIHEQARMMNTFVLALRKAQLSELQSVSILNNNPVRDEQGFKVYEIKCTVSGEMNQLRTFINELTGAIKNYQFFVVDALSFKLATDEASELLASKTADLAKSKEDKVPAGPHVIGNNKRVIFDMQIKYVVYEGTTAGGSENE